MELYEKTVDTQPSLTLPWQETLLMPISDIQYGGQGSDLKKLKRHIEWGVAHGAYFTGVGDYLDVASPSGRSKFKKSEFYDSVQDAMDARVEQHLEELMEVLKPSRGRWLLLSKGHHWWEFGENSQYAGFNSDQVLADFLGCPVSESAAITQVKFRDERGHRAVAAQIWQHHGEGSGVTMASPLNKLERIMSRFPTVDIFLIAHYSRKVAYPVDTLVPVFGKNPRLRAKRRILACTGGFMKGYEVGSRPSYVERGMMPPTNLGGLLIKMRPVHSENEDRLDLSVEL